MQRQCASGSFPLPQREPGNNIQFYSYDLYTLVMYMHECAGVAIAMQDP